MLLLPCLGSSRLCGCRLFEEWELVERAVHHRGGPALVDLAGEVMGPAGTLREVDGAVERVLHVYRRDHVVATEHCQRRRDEGSRISKDRVSGRIGG